MINARFMLITNMASHELAGKKNKNAVQRGRSSWSQIAFTLAAIEADINKSQNKELQMVQCHIHFGVTRVRHSADTVGQLSGISIEKYSTKL